MENNNILKSSVIIGLSFIIGFIIISYSLIQIKSFDNLLVVTGSSKQLVVSDIAKWNASFSRSSYDTNLNNGYTKMKSDEEIVRSFLRENGVSENEITITPVSMQKNYKYDSNYDKPDEYTLTQNVTIESNDIEKIKLISTSAQSVIEKGVIFSANAPQYYYSKLSESRIDLLPLAMEDARKRAESISGKKAGSLKSVSMGVVQVLQPNSVDISDYGMYDTSTVEKEIMITVRASFSLK
ncbi:MAG: SIMPL domain-containing protein [Candidatus Pacebacteria bacterium]|nr:SIMPL domain-containing protein [Candidatus Paceibacterota bacterium]MDD2757034.1 SIMPL domain-containing protein [Candidatus Paceibacterota bacterium]MDD3283543.1 SIMPL domain-containing protein [Candidatus Paceibacterota bacterium]MDD3969600.1 SIMPL domain-containing protein [Candidatus Paceibacterota bacterium]MDD4737854.1 SIMPL domain-containing protein [Candidatus Paceibacterota bacterium]